MAILIANSNNFISLSLDGTTDFDVTTDLVNLGLARNAPNGLRIRSITYVPGAIGDAIIIRDGQGGPAILVAAGILALNEIVREEFRDDGKIDRGKLMSPYMAAAERVVGVDNHVFVTFEL